MGKRKLSTFERLSRGKLSRKQRKELSRRLWSEDPGLEVIHRHAAAIDIGDKSHFVAVMAEGVLQPVREFGSWTAELQVLVEWLKFHKVQSVAMQSTGVYWIAVYEMLEKAGFQVWLVNARDTRNLPGHKSDVQECQWILKLHTFGLLRNSFRPPEAIRGLRTVWRARQRHVGEAGRTIQHMQKALTTMNVQLANAISDISGVSGQAIIRAILKGERDPYKLARLCDYRVQASEEEIARSLEGNWQEDVLFELQQAVKSYDFYQQLIGECDQQLEKYLGALPTRERIEVQAPVATEVASGGAGADEPAGKKKKKSRPRKPRKNQPGFDLEAELQRVCGVNLASLPGVDVMTIQTFVAEVGTDMTPWPDEDHLVSWLKLSPQRQVSGGRLIKHERSQNQNRVAQALRMAASTLDRSDSYLGARFRSLRSRLGPTKAIKAMAAHLARLFYRMLTRGQVWVDRGVQEYEKRRHTRDQMTLERRAAALGFRLVRVS